ncbi:MAG: NEAT domain-containing protein, partial [Clostridiales Family XIII bacterium]|nr:NEAT domain-containing protein [Clostridiales Family XIII bacterium]
MNQKPQPTKRAIARKAACALLTLALVASMFALPAGAFADSKDAPKQKAQGASTAAAAQTGTAKITARHATNDEGTTMLAQFLTPDATLEMDGGVLYATVTFATPTGNAINVAGMNGLNTYVSAGGIATRYDAENTVADADAKTYTAKLRMTGGELGATLLELRIPPMPMAQSVRLFLSDIAWQDDSAAVSITDLNLRKAILDALGVQYAGDSDAQSKPVTENMMARLTTLDAHGRGITNVTGLAKAVNLQNLDLSGNPLGYAFAGSATIGALTKLKTLNLSNCNLASPFTVVGSSFVANPTWNGSAGLKRYLANMADLEVLNLSDNGLLSNFGLLAAVYPSLRVVDVSNCGITKLELASCVMPALERFDVSGGYYYPNEDTVGFENVVALGIDNFIFDNQGKLADLFEVWVAKPGMAVTTPSLTGVATSYTLNRIPADTYQIDLGDTIASQLDLGFKSYADNSYATVNDKEVLAALPPAYTITSLASSPVLEMGQNSFTVDVRAADGTTQAYTLRVNRVALPQSADNESAGIADVALQTAVCAKLTGKPDPSTHIVTKSEMETLTGELIVDSAADLSGIQYATALATLTLRNGRFTTLPDLSGITTLKTMALESYACTTFPEVSALPPALTTLHVLMPKIRSIPDLDTTALTALTLGHYAASGSVYDKLVGLPELTALPKMPASLLELNLLRLENVYELPVGIENIQLQALKVVRCGIADFSRANVLKGTLPGLRQLEIAQPAVSNISGLAGNDKIITLRITDTVEGTSIESGATDGMPALTSLTIRNCPISEMPQFVANCPQLTTVALAFCNFTDIPNSVAQAQAITSLDISYNQIGQINTDLSSLTALKTLDISNNKLKDWPENIEVLRALTILRMNNLNIRDMSAADMSSFPLLTTFSLLLSGVESLPDIRPCTELQQFTASGNRYTDLPANFFDGLTKLRTVSLGDMMILDPAANEPLPGSGAAQALATMRAISTAPSVSVVINSGTYASIRAIDSDFGKLDVSYATGLTDVNGEASLIVPAGTKNIAFTPDAYHASTVFSVDGTPFTDSYTFSNLLPGVNTLTIKATNPNISTIGTSKPVYVHITVIVGEALGADAELQEGRTYLVPYSIMKRDTASFSMADTYFTHQAKVVRKAGKYQVDISTSSANDIPAMKYSLAETYAAATAGNWTDTLRHSQVGNSVWFRMAADSLEKPIYLKPRVMPMGGSWPECRLDFHLNAPIYDITTDEADASELSAAVGAADELVAKGSVFTDETWGAFAQALAAAKTVLESAQSGGQTQAQVDEAKAALVAAQGALVKDPAKIADKSALNGKIAEAKALAKGSHTDASWNALQEAIADAEEIAADDWATPREVSTATSSLNIAVTMFVTSGDASKLDKDSLPDGSYTVHIDMIRSADHRSKSMADGAVNHTARLTVEDGNYYATLGFKGMTINLNGQDMFGYLQHLKYYESGYGWNYGEPTGAMSEAEVLDIWKNADGSVLTDHYNNASTPYPKSLRFPLVDKAGYADNDVPLQVFVPIMESIAAGNGT